MLSSHSELHFRGALYRPLIAQIEDDIIVTGGNLGGNIYVWDHFSDEPRYTRAKALLVIVFYAWRSLSLVSVWFFVKKVLPL